MTTLMLSSTSLCNLNVFGFNVNDLAKEFYVLEPNRIPRPSKAVHSGACGKNKRESPICFAEDRTHEKS